MKSGLQMAIYIYIYIYMANFGEIHRVVYFYNKNQIYNRMLQNSVWNAEVQSPVAQQ
jgi:hypothetical protein